MTRVTIVMLIIITLNACTSTEILQGIQGVQEALEGEKPLTQEETASGLKEALGVGIKKGADMVSKEDGYFKNPSIKLPFPPNAIKIANTLRDMGLGKQVDNVILTLNRAAEDAAQEAKPIFISAIKQMTIKDAINILTGKKDAATQYLRKTTTNQLTAAFKPKIEISLDKVNATKYWSNVMNTYNKIPFVEKINPDLAGFVTNKALDGLFFMVAKEEAAIRENPIARVSALLKRVFGYHERNKD